MITEEQILRNIAEIRKELGYSQEYMGSKIGLEQAGYALIERGQRGLTVSRLLQIADVFNLNVIDVILHGVDNKAEGVREPEVKAQLTIELKADKRDQVLKLVFGDNNLEILNK